MKTKNGKQLLMLLLLLLSSLMSFGDDVQEKLNLDYFRTPEAAAFKKYGEESVNEYTGTADISVPLYTIKSRDIEIPLVLRYDASGIKVEQEASWVGLGWNLMVGGCINYVCAGAKDMYCTPYISSEYCTEYLTSDFGEYTLDKAMEAGVYKFGTNQPQYWSRILYYTYNPNETSNWMAKLPFSPHSFVKSYKDHFSGYRGEMNQYVEMGFGERDFYSVNVMGKSFMFFIDPFTLKVFKIGKAGEEFMVIPEYYGICRKGVGNQPDVDKWKIKDSDGYSYYFSVGDNLCDRVTNYKSCWYLTKIETPLGEIVELEYSEQTKEPRQTLYEALKKSFLHEYGAFCCHKASQDGYIRFLQNENSNMKVKSHYLSKIRTKNQLITFVTTDDNKCSGKKLDAIKVDYDNGSTMTNIKTIKFSYGSFGHTKVGGNYAPNDRSYNSEDRLKLNSVSEIASSDTFTTSFYYNETILLPSKRSCAQDYWGYYNGQENNVPYRGHSLIPTTSRFMSSRYSDRVSDINGADRFSRGEYMQAAMLNKIVYPTGGYTTYEYEANSILVSDFTLTEKYREKRYDASVSVSASCASSPYGPVYNDLLKKEFTLSKETTFELFYQSNGGVSSLYGKDLKIEIRKWNDNTKLFDLVKNTTVNFEMSRDLSSVLQDITHSPGKY